MNHAVGSARQHRIGFTATDDFGGFSDRLAAGRTCGETVEVRALRVETSGEVSRGHVRFLFQFFGWIEQTQSGGNELGRVVGSIGKCRDHHFAERVEVLVAFTTAQINADPRGILDRRQNAAVLHRLSGSRDRELGVTSALDVFFTVFNRFGDVPVFDFRTDASGETAGVEQRRWRNATAAFLKARPNGGDIPTHWVDHTDSGDDDSATRRHGRLQIFVKRNRFSVSRDGDVKEVHHPHHGQQIARIEERSID